MNKFFGYDEKNKTNLQVVFLLCTLILVILMIYIKVQCYNNLPWQSIFPFETNALELKAQISLMIRFAVFEKCHHLSPLFKRK